MSQQLRQLKSRIRSIEGTWKVTRAMEMVAMSKFKAVESPMEMARRYFKKLDAVTMNLLKANEEQGQHPFLTRKSNGSVGIFVITSDAGLCGVYNNNILKRVEKFIAEHKGPFKIYAFGRKAVSYFKKRGIAVERAFPGFHGRLKSNFHETILGVLAEEFTAGRIRELYVAYTIFENPMKNTPTMEKLLPVEQPPVSPSNFLIEAGMGGIMSDVIPMFIDSRFRLMFLESFTSEHSARMVAMKSAKDNAKELMGDLILLRNKMRQTIITKEVIEIISSAEALKG